MFFARSNRVFLRSASRGFRAHLLTRGALLGACALPLWALGCGGGGGGGPKPSPTATPTARPTNTPVGTPTRTPVGTPTATPSGSPTRTPAPTPTPSGGNVIVIRLVDPLGEPVDGIVTVNVFRQATVGGQVVFSGLKPGSYTAQIVVNGVTTTRNFTSIAGTTTVDVTINPNATPEPTGTVPAPPF